MGYEPPFKVGDRVLSALPKLMAHVVRRVTKVRQSGSSGSGWSVDVDGGECCHTCGVAPARPSARLDASHLRLAREEPER